MSEFIRGLNRDFIAALNELYKDSNSFWHKILNDKELFVGIRDDSVHVYFYGSRLCELQFISNVMIGETAKKYFGIAEEGSIKSYWGKVQDEKSKIKSLSELGGIKNYSKPYRGDEKGEAYKEILNNSNHVIDVEIRLPMGNQIDYVRVENNQLVFYEAKYVQNRKEINSLGKTKVLSQIHRYEKILSEHSEDIISAYKLVCQNLMDLNSLEIRFNAKSKLINDDLTIDFKPRLIIFNVSRNSFNDMLIKEYQDALGEDRVIIRYKDIRIEVKD